MNSPEDTSQHDSQPGALRALWRSVSHFFGGSPEERFSSALIALAAKMAKADGVATQGEFEAFRQVFAFDEAKLSRVRMLFDLAKKDTSGFETYARRIASDFAGQEALLEDVLDGLFHIAKADGAVHEGERAQLEIIAEIFGFIDQAFEAILARHVVDGACDAYRVLGVTRDMADAELKSHYRKLVSENHPDRMMSRGLPPEMIRIANDRLAAINHAWEQVRLERGL